ncbi:hypothetical protein ACFE04_026958 [Oxalis oulophora]
MKAELMEDVIIISGLVAVQFVYAGNSVLLGYLMSMGLNPLTIVIFSTSATFLFLSPFALYFERSKWPKRCSLKLLIQLVLISFGGVTLFNSLFLKGIQLTSPAMATAMPNLAPGFIFVIAWTLGLEQIKISCVYSKVKIVGTSLCVVGALTMSIMHSASTVPLPDVHEDIQHSSNSKHHDVIFDEGKIIGCVYLMAAVFVLSSNVVLQATTLRSFPAPISLCAITSFIGVIITAGIELLQSHKIDLGWPIVTVADLLIFSLLGGAVGGVCVSFNGWAMKKRGPVLVSMFSPIGAVISVILSVITLGEKINLGSLAGMFLMFTGLYFVLWAKGKENFGSGDSSDSELDEEKPLLLN